MKDIIAFILTLCLMCALCPFCFASQQINDNESGFSVPVIDTASVLTPDNLYDDANADLIYTLGKTPAQMKKIFDDGGYVFRAFTNDKKYILSLSVIKNSLSEAVIDLINCPENEKSDVRSLLIGSADKSNDSTVKEIEHNGAYFYKVTTKGYNGTASVSAISVINGSCVTLTMDVLSDGLTKNAVSLFDTMFDGMDYTVKSEQLQAKESAIKLYKTLLWVAIAVAALVFIFIIRAILLDVHRRRLENDWKNNVHRKPRR